MARGNGIADIRNYRWINLRKAPTMIWRFPSCAQCRAAEALNQILFRSQAQEDLVTLRLSDTAVLQPVALLCSRTVRCSLCAISLSFFSLFPNSTFALFHFLSSPHKIKCATNIDTSLLKRITGLENRILRGRRRRWKASWLPEHSVLDIQPSDCCSALFSHLRGGGCPASADSLHCQRSSTLQLQSGGIPTIAESLMRVFTGDIHWNLLFICFCLLASQKN